jgi:hypothetical protein
VEDIASYVSTKRPRTLALIAVPATHFDPVPKLLRPVSKVTTQKGIDSG